MIALESRPADSLCEVPELMSSMDVIANLLYLSDIASDPDDALKYATMAKNRLFRMSRLLNA